MSSLNEIDFDSGNVSDKGEGASEQDVAKVSDNLKKAAQVWSQIQTSQSHNQNLSVLLALLIIHIENNKIWSYINEFFEKKSISIESLFSFFIPFLKQYIEKEDIRVLYADIIDIKVNGVADYSKVLKKIYDRYEDIHNTDSDFVINFIEEIVVYFDVGELSSTFIGREKEQEEYIQKLKLSLKKDIFTF